MQKYIYLHRRLFLGTVTNIIGCFLFRQESVCTHLSHSGELSQFIILKLYYLALKRHLSTSSSAYIRRHQRANLCGRNFECCIFDKCRGEAHRYTKKTSTNKNIVVHVCFLPIHSGHQVCWTSQPGSHRRKATQDFSSTFLLRCVPEFFSREGFSHSFRSSTVKSNFV